MHSTHHEHLGNTQELSDRNSEDRLPGTHRSVRNKGIALGRPFKLALVMVALVGGFYLLREHWSHVAGNWIYLLLLACPLMHLFHGHGGHGGHAAPPVDLTNKKE
jgi:hypothetical protein